MTILKYQRVAILGAGIMGSSLALMLARRGSAVDLFDREPVAMAGASRWNEGKIHLGYIYGADPSLLTARHVLDGGLVFGPILSDLIAADISAHVTAKDDLYLIHRNSVVAADALQKTYASVSELIRQHPDKGQYLADVSHAKVVQLSQADIAEIADPDSIVSGFRVPERSINTNWVADRLCEAIAAEPLINLRINTEITAAQPVDLPNGQWRVSGDSNLNETYDLVVNALWDGRLAIDVAAGLATQPGWSNRFRLSLFARTKYPVKVNSVVIAVGPFGDVKNYDGRDFYLSWYPAGLIADSSELQPMLAGPLTARLKLKVFNETREGLATLLPSVRAIFDAAESIRIEGGWVFAQGQGRLDDPNSSLHRRDRFGIQRHGNYFSVDTGKYSTAPWLAARLAETMAGEAR